MGMRVAEAQVRLRRFGPKAMVRVDLHGVSLHGPGDNHIAIRWEWIEEVEAGASLTVRSAKEAITIPAGAFGLTPLALGERLEQARSITRRTDIIAELSGGLA
jgi:hypothetical protein